VGEPELIPWRTVCVDLVGPYTLKLRVARNKQTGEKKVVKKITLQLLTMIDPATRWFEAKELLADEVDAEWVAMQLDSVWLCRYPRPLRCIFDNGKEFVGNEFQELLQSYDIKPVPTTVKNPQTNAVLEQVHQVMGNMLRMFELQSMSEAELENPRTIANVVANVCFAIRTTFHTILQANPGQLVFGRDMIFPTTYVANWANIAERKRDQMIRDNMRENAKRITYDYQVGDLVLLRKVDIQQKMKQPTSGPYRIVQVFVNGTVMIQKGRVRERVNVRRLVPYHQRPH
jgi:Integrase core domain